MNDPVLCGQLSGIAIWFIVGWLLQLLHSAAGASRARGQWEGVTARIALSALAGATAVLMALRATSAPPPDYFPGPGALFVHAFASTALFLVWLEAAWKYRPWAARELRHDR